MNERVKELAEQSGFVFPSFGDVYASGSIKHAMDIFVELIVRECISTIEIAENGYEDYRNQIEDRMRDHCIWLIKDKFGVE